MKADFESIGKQLPYSEPEGYVDRLVERCADRAIEHQRAAGGKNRVGPFSRRVGIITASMAAAILAATIVFPAILDRDNRYSADDIAHSMSLSEVLSGMSNDELAAIDYYSFDDMPTNYEDDYEE